METVEYFDTAGVVLSVCLYRKRYNLRLGQAMFNWLPPEASSVIAGTLFDPFHKKLEVHELSSWIENHLIFDGPELIAVFFNNQILWEKQ